MKKAKANNSTGTISRRGNSFVVGVSAGVDPVTNKRRRIWRTVRTTSRAVAQEELIKLQYEQNTGTVATSGDMRVGAWLDTWLEVHVKDNPNNTVRTFQSYESHVRVWVKPAIGMKRLDKLSATDIQTMVNNITKKQSAATAKKVFTTLKISLNRALKDDLITKNVYKNVDVPKVESFQAYVPDESGLKEIFAVADQTELKTLVRLAAASGLRRGELVALKWKSVDLVDIEEARIRVVESAVRVRGQGQTVGKPKSAESKRTVPIDENTARMLKTHLAKQNTHALSLGGIYSDEGFVFANLTGDMLDLDHVSQGVKRILIKANHPNARLHDLRHYNASRLLASGASFVAVKERLGHASAAFTLNTYVHGTESDQRVAAEAMSEVFAI